MIRLGTVGLGRIFLTGMAACAMAAPPPQANSRAADLQRIAIDRIERAPTPRMATEAYREGLAQDPDSIALRHAFVQRMVTLGRPHLAEPQALELNQRDPRDGLAWGVLAFTRAAAGDTNEGLRNIVSASRYAPNDFFVGRIAGRLLAWFDTEADWRQVPPDLRQALNGVREQLRNTEPFATTYWIGRRSYEMRNNQGLPNVATPFSSPLYLPPVTEDAKRYVAPRPRTAQVTPRSERGTAGERFARNANPALRPPLPQQPLPRGAPRPEVKQPAVPPSVPLTQPPPDTERNLHPPGQ